MNRRDLLRMMAVIPAGLVAAKFLSAQGELTLEPLSDGFHVLMGAGGNITVLNTKDGLLVVDAGLPNTTDAVMGKVKGVAYAPVKSLINTHWHNDHTGGNVAFGKEGASITAHVNTLKRVSMKQHMVFFNRDVEPLASVGLPKKTFAAGEKMSFGGETLRIEHHPPAHTDGDSTVHFAQANILSAGDLFFSGMYPFIDYSSGGSIEGMIHNAMSLANMLDSGTKVVPGHGPMAGKADLVAFHDMLADVNEAVSALVKQGKSADEVWAAGPTKRYDARLGNGFLKPEMFVKMLHQGKTGFSAKKAA